MVDQQPQEGSFHSLLHRLDRALRADLERRLAPHGFSLPEWSILAQCAHGVQTPAALADCLEIDRSAVTRLLDTLEEKWAVERGPHPTDKRSVVLKLTEAGEALFPQLLEHSRGVNRDALSPLAAAEAETFLGTLRKLVARLPRRAPNGDCGET